MNTYRERDTLAELQGRPRRVGHVYSLRGTTEPPTTRPDYLERAHRISRALRIYRGGRRDNSGLNVKIARSAQDDSVRYETSYVPRHCKVYQVRASTSDVCSVYLRIDINLRIDI
mgnify:CR=1 FL=1